MRILYLCTFYHRALFFRQQMNALIKRGHIVRAFNSAQYGEGVAEKFRPIMDDLVVHSECWNKIDRLLFFPRQWKIEKQFKNAYKFSSYDLIHSHLLLSSGYTALRIKKQDHIPYIVSVRSTDLTGFIRLPYFRRLAVKILKEANGVHFLSNCHKITLIENFLNKDEATMLNKKSVVIGNCLEKFWQDNTVEAGKHIPAERKTIKILAVAKIKPVKNLTIAAQAVEILCKRGYKATFTVIGEKQDNTEYKKISRYKCVCVLPFMKKEDLIQEYRSHDIFLLPSTSETFGRVYIEAMTQGLPVLYTANQGFDGTFPDGKVGYPVPNNKPEEIANRIEDIMNNYEIISDNCVKMSKYYYENVIIDQLENFYQNSLSDI